MGQAAIPIMIITTLASTAVAVSNSRSQAALANRQADENAKLTAFSNQQESNRIKAAGREQEIDRLRALRALIGENIVSSVSSGLTIEGTPNQIIESNIEKAREDINIIRGNTEAMMVGQMASGQAQQNAIESGREAANVAAKNQQTGAIIGGIGSAAGYGSGRV